MPIKPLHANEADPLKSQAARSAVDKHASQAARSAVDKHASQAARSAVDKHASQAARSAVDKRESQAARSAVDKRESQAARSAVDEDDSALSFKTPIASKPDRATLQIAMLALDGAMASSMVAPLDAFRIANALHARSHPGAIAPFHCRLINARQSGDRRLNQAKSKQLAKDTVRCAGGFELGQINSDASLDTIDLLLIPGFEYRGPAELKAALQTMQAEIRLIQQAYERKLIIGASCSGTFLLAQSGVLDGKRAATSWWLAPLFKREFPNVQLDATALYCFSDNVMTAGATTAMFTVVIRYIESTLGAELAQNTARFLLIDYERQSQAAFISDALIARPRSAFNERVESYLQRHLSDTNLSIDALAAHCRMSARTLVRRFQSVYHKSPQMYLQQLRIERAKLLLETSLMTLAEVITAVGYNDLSSFRKLFKRMTDSTPNQYRQRFSIRGA
jgi:transcriptional regulator GlxA family with amidase domain